MNQIIIDKAVSGKFKQDLLTAWQEGHGGNAEKIHVFHGEEGVVLIIPEALYPAELDLQRASREGGRILHEYLRTLLESVASDFITTVEEMAEKNIGDVIPLIDLRAGWAIAFFQFK
ncbi:MAG: hypothetical protein GWN30_27580 [Gammaproteobacteria bacterium]|nr:hypothetical protein [Gammaproteobacteria bacterium]